MTQIPFDEVFPHEQKIVERNPLDAYINTLLNVIGVPKEGDDIPMAAIEEAINLQRHTYKWTSVIARWKNELRIRHGVIIVCKYGLGTYHAANDDEKIAEAMRRKGKAENEIVRISTILDTVDRGRLNDDNKALFDTIRLNMQRQKLMLAHAVK